MSKAAPKLVSATRTDVGKIRKLNEDACLARPDIGLWTVADGMGGHTAGDLASQMIVNALAKIKPTPRLSELVDFVEHSVLGVNNRLFELGEAQNQTSGSTVVVLLAAAPYCVYMWAGDSRLYRLRQGALQQLTTDHTQVELYIEQGLIERGDAEQHQVANMITRAVGAASELMLDLDMDELADGDRFLLCSDGLDKHLSDHDIAKCLGGGDVDSAAERLVAMTLERGGSDNVTVCVVDVQ